MSELEKYFNTISKSLAVIGGGLVWLLGGWDNFLMALVTLMCVDYVTGVIKGINNKELSSKTGMNGIVKKIYILAIVCVAVVCERMGIPTVREMTIVFFVANEALSILENAGQMGLPIPESLKSALIQIREKKEVVESAESTKTTELKESEVQG